MRKIASALLLLALSAPAFAQSGTPANDKPAQTAQTAQLTPKKSLYICWYRSDGRLTGYKPSHVSVTPYDPLPTNRGGKYAWFYEIRAMSGKGCPSYLFG